MNGELQAFADAWGEKPKDWPKLRSLAKAYVAANRGELEARFKGLTRDDLVSVVSMARRQERREDMWIAEAWLLSEYEPQHIVGGGLGG